MSIFAVLVSFSMFFSTAPGCAQNPHLCMITKDSCLSEPELKKVDEFCSHGLCGACMVQKVQDVCYETYGSCKQTAGSCEWEKTAALENCVKQADEKEAACRKKECQPNGACSDNFLKCIEDSKKELVPAYKTNMIFNN